MDPDFFGRSDPEGKRSQEVPDMRGKEIMKKKKRKKNRKKKKQERKKTGKKKKREIGNRPTCREDEIERKGERVYEK